jgi:CheY-like chemotaxis protein
MLSVWFVDDLESNRKMWLNSFPPDILEKHALRTFSSVAALFKAAQSEALPHVLFIDYYIGKDFGHEVVDYFLNTDPRPFLVAHSSAFAANRAMVQQGADIMLEKKPGRDFTASIRQHLRDESDLLAWVNSLSSTHKH